MSAAKEAAKRLLSRREPYLGYSDGGMQGDAIAVSVAYLAEHPEDDDEPVTKEWYKERYDDICVVGVLEDLMDDRNEEGFPKAFATRGQLRLLLRALGNEGK
jgi:hypothetical protein